jgi:NTE family protein
MAGLAAASAGRSPGSRLAVGYHSRMTSPAGYALVIGGGGLVGGAWELGILSGLRARGLGRPDFVLGTSIGSIVGAAVCADALEESVLRPAAALRPVLDAYLGRVDPTLMAQIMGRGFGLDAAERATIGELAARADSGPETEFIDHVATLLSDDAWPPGLAVSGVAIDDGEFVIWDEHSDVPLARAVAASCAGPGLFPPVRVKGRRFIDGGVRSPTNADRAAGYGRVLVITAMMDAEFRMLLDQETASLRSDGAEVLGVVPDEASSMAIGPDTFDLTRLDSALIAGRRQALYATELRFA